MSLYRIQSVQTKYFVVSDGKESDGSVLATIQDSDFNPSTTVCILDHVPNPERVDNGRMAGC